MGVQNSADSVAVGIGVSVGASSIEISDTGDEIGDSGISASSKKTLASTFCRVLESRLGFIGLKSSSGTSRGDAAVKIL